MVWILAGFVGIFGGEFFLRVPILKTLRVMKVTGQNARRLFLSPSICDEKKEKVMRVYALRMFTSTLLLFFYLVVLVGILAVLHLAGRLVGLDLFVFLSTPVGLIYVTMVSSIYTVMKLKARRSDYGLLSRILHTIALGNRSVPEASFDFEQGQLKIETEAEPLASHVFICGLARAGTTLLMRRFYATSSYRSLTYADMPFVLMPNIWAKFSAINNAKAVKQRRAHGDDLLVDINSPEALEEVFWKTFCGDQYIGANSLIPMDADDETIGKFRAYVTAITYNEREATDDLLPYLSKNNNNILRLNSITRAFPHAHILIPYREPLQHAYSLLRQHRNFLKQQKEDPFVRKYMTWLAHHEFGSDHRPFMFSDNTEYSSNTDSLTYWLEVWVNTYSWLLEHAPSAVTYVSYEKLCAKPESTWQDLCAIAGIAPHVMGADVIQLTWRDVPEAYDAALMTRANKLYEVLSVHARSL
ncbi:Unannotated [Lentimonas sp. CC19]|nr:Unannotated [Lentimonas sp. CC10]CAA6697315.1 Unannotated [Lentimonas sp. CC19]CAA7072263.1 Unannotated [Lentimonas sp. CC11]